MRVAGLRPSIFRPLSPLQQRPRLEGTSSEWKGWNGDPCSCGFQLARPWGSCSRGLFPPQNTKPFLNVSGVMGGRAGLGLQNCRIFFSLNRKRKRGIEMVMKSCAVF